MNKKLLAHFLCLIILVGTEKKLMAQDAFPYMPSAYTGVLNNYVRTWEAHAPVANPADILTRPLKDVKQATLYVDGLGRPSQTVAKQGSYVTGSSQPLDLVSPVVYDEFGRESRKYLPFAAAQNNGVFKLDAFEQQKSFYDNQLTNQGESFYYGKTEYESSPLNRIDRNYAAGDNWVHNGHGVESKYFINAAADDVKKWSVTDVAGGWGTYTMDGAYAEGVLYKNITVDEQGKQVVEFKDQDGRVILKKVQLTAASDNGPGSGYTGWLCTYNIYDNLGELRCVIQPKGVEYLVANNWNINALSGAILSELSFRYEYDARSRMIRKQVPGTTETWMVYDARDRLVMSQDANMRSNQQWLYTQYDDKNRPVAMGLLTDPNNYNNLSYHLGLAYSSTSYPSLGGYTTEELTRTFYDDYTWRSQYGNPLSDTYNNSYDSYFLPASNTVWPYAQANVQSAGVAGLITGTRVKVVGSSNTYLYSVKIYDDKGRLIQLQSTNITLGTDMVTTQYSWSGQPWVLVQKLQKGGSANPQTHIVVSKMNYDDLGRLLTVTKTVNSTINSVVVNKPEVTIVRNEYDALGQLKTTKLGQQKDVSGNYVSSELESLNYEYNIRGWLLGVNRDFVKDAASNKFGFELGYDKAPTIIAGNNYATPQYNGNISGTIWKSIGDLEKRKYDYGYDAASRLTGADFNQYTGAGFNKTAGMDFSVSNLSYDANGNILTMKQMGYTLGGSTLIDDLQYNYFTFGNKLKNVIDGANNPQTALGDFRASALYTSALPSGKTANTTDYAYDGNGNLRRDLNKDMGTASSFGINYNYLNLPKSVTMYASATITKGTVIYTYDAAGNKLKKVVTDNSTSGKTITTTSTYLGGAVFESRTTVPADANNLDYTDKLLFISDEGGRIRFTPANGAAAAKYDYDYFIKDHLGNIRMVLTDEQQKDIYPPATLEGSQTTGALSMVNYEKQYYTINNTYITDKSNIPSWQTANDYINNNGDPSPDSRYPSGYTVSGTGTSSKLYRLNAATNKTGLDFIAKVMAGDHIDIFGKSYYQSTQTFDNSNSTTLVLSSIIAGFLGAPDNAGVASKGVTSPLMESWNNGVGGIPASFFRGANGESVSTPKAYINYIFFDEHFKYAGGGASRVGSSGTVKDHYAELQNIQAPKNGYIYVYASNESNADVFFDNLQVMHTRGPELEETHYYPWGLKMSAICSNSMNFGGSANKYKFNDKEEQSHEFSDGSSLEWLDFGARMYDAQIGRWHVIDEWSEKYQSFSPYHFVLNNPILHFDVDGRGDSAINKKTYKGAEKIGPATPVRRNADGSVTPESSEDCYNCHSYAWDNSSSDPGDPGNPKGLSRWDNDPLNNTGDYTELDFNEKNQPGDRVMYFSTDDNGNVVVTHSAVVTKVDGSGNTVEVQSKWGEGALYKHHPRDVPKMYNKEGEGPTFTAHGQTYASRVYFRYDVHKAISNPNNPAAISSRVRSDNTSTKFTFQPASKFQTYTIKPIK